MEAFYVLVFQWFLECEQSKSVNKKRLNEDKKRQKKKRKKKKKWKRIANALNWITLNHNMVMAKNNTKSS